MKKFALILVCSFLMIIGFGCKANVNEPENQVENQETPESPTTENQNPSNPSSPAAALVNQFFWGQWQRMDNGKSYYINENNIKTDERLCSATSSSENYLNVEGLGRFEKQTDSVIINNSIPYFRKGGTNLSYKMKLVGFEDSINRAARAASSASLSGYTITGTSEQFESFTSEAVSDEDGSVTLTAPTSGDVQTITVTSGDDTIVVVPGIKVETDGSNMGTIPISQEGQYSLKVTGTIEDSEKDDGYLYGNNYKSYPMKLTITNVSDVVSAPSVCTITAEDSRVTVSSADGSDITGGVLISTLKSGFTKTILLSVTCGTLTESYLDTGLIVTVKNAATEKTWQDYVPLRFFKGLVPITVAAESVEENADAALNGFVIYPDGNSQFFSVTDKGDKTIYVPTFGIDQPYTLAFSGATIEGLLSKSTEMLYTVASGTCAKKEIDTAAMAFIDAVQYGETGSGNGSEDNATVADSEFEAYLADGDVDFYEMTTSLSETKLPSERKIYITYRTEKGNTPLPISLEYGVQLTADELPLLKNIDGYSFDGWYQGNEYIQAGFLIKKDLVLFARWVKGMVINSDNASSFDLSYLSSIPNSETIYLRGVIYSSQLKSIISRIANQTYYMNINLTFDMSMADIGSSLCCADNKTSWFKDCKNIRRIILPKNLTNIGAYSFYNCKYIFSVDFPKSLESIGESAFENSAIKSLILENIETIGHKAFSTTGLESVTLKNCKTLAALSFAYNSSISNLCMENIADIGSSAFSTCGNIKTILIDAKIIYPSAFYNCYNLTEIILSENVKEIQGTNIGGQVSSAFERCPLVSVKFLDTNNWYRKSWNSDYKSPIDVTDEKQNASALSWSSSDTYIKL